MQLLPLLAALHHFTPSAASPLRLVRPSDIANAANPATAGIDDHVTFDDVNYTCVSAADGVTVDREEQRRLWDELNVGGYLVDWFAQRKPTLKNESGGETSLFGISRPGEKGPFFPDVFSAWAIENHATNNPGEADQMRCEWGECEALSCTRAKKIGLDFRAWLILEAIENAQQTLFDFEQAFLWSAVENDLATKQIVESVAHNFYQPEKEQPDKRAQTALTAISVIGSIFGAIVPFAGPAFGASKAVAGIIGAGKIAGPASKFLPGSPEEPPKPVFTPEDIEKEINNGLKKGMEEYNRAIRGAFHDILHVGRHPQEDWSQVNNKRAGELMADFLGDPALWEAKMDRDVVRYTVNRIALNGALQGSRHFVVKNLMPHHTGMPDSDWVYNCNRLAGGVADTENRICWSLQAMRSDGKWPFADHSEIGWTLKSDPNNRYHIKDMLDFYRTLDSCAKANNYEPYKAWPTENLDDFSTAVLGGTAESKNNLTPCLFNIPVLERYSVCDKVVQETFPWDRPDCDWKKKDGNFVEQSFPQDRNLNAFNAGVRACNVRESRHKWDEQFVHGTLHEETYVACSNKLPEDTGSLKCFGQNHWMHPRDLFADIEAMCGRFDGHKLAPKEQFGRVRNGLKTHDGKWTSLDMRIENRGDDEWTIRRDDCIKDMRELVDADCNSEKRGFITAGGRWTRGRGMLEMDLNSGDGRKSCFKTKHIPLDKYEGAIKECCEEIGDVFLQEGEKRSARRDVGDGKTVEVRYEAKKKWDVRVEDCKRDGWLLVSEDKMCRGKNPDSAGGNWDMWNGVFAVDSV